ncbi:MAG: glutamyl-tRNA reductase [Solirubrobacterales bacterium]
MSELLAIGVSHKTAPLALRERLAMTESAAEEFIRELVAHEEIREAVVISTCNRTEVYIVSRESVDAESVLLARLAHRADIRPTELVDIVYSPRNCDAARHLFKVTAGLESMIVGEHEIQGQVRRSYETALGAGTTGPFTNRLFRAALQAGKRVRSETALGTARVSVPSVAVDLARETVGPLDRSSVVVIGAGETAELTARALSDQGVSTLFVANRRVERARELASTFDGAVASLDELPQRMREADIVVSSTSSPHPIVGAEEIERVMEGRDGRPLLLIDIAVPRDIDSACAEVPGVHVLDMDDLQNTVARNLDVREGEREGAEAVVEPEELAQDGQATVAAGLLEGLHPDGGLVEEPLHDRPGDRLAT